MKKATGYYFKIVLAWMVTIAFAYYFLSLLGRQIREDKEYAGINSRNVGMATNYDDVMSQDDASLDEGGIANKHVIAAFEQIRKDKFDDALDVISKIGDNQYLKNNKASIQEYLLDFSDWYKEYKELQQYYNMPKNERKKNSEPDFTKDIQSFIKSGACESYFGDKKSEYAPIVPYTQFKLMNKLFKDHVGEDYKDEFIKKHIGAAVYKTYIDTFTNGKESLSDEDGDVICGYIYASFVGARENWKNEKAEKDELESLEKEIDAFRDHNTWKADLSDNGKLSIQWKYLQSAKSRIRERIEKGGFRRNYDKSKNLEPYNGW